MSMKTFTIPTLKAGDDPVVAEVKAQHGPWLLVEKGGLGLVHVNFHGVLSLAPTWTVPKANAWLGACVTAAVLPSDIVASFKLSPASVNLGLLGPIPKPLLRAIMAALDRPWEVVPHTQKARGVVALTKAPTTKALVPSTLVVQEPDDVPTLTVPKFVRPCPPTPNHGGVESRLVSTREEAVAVLNEAQTAIPGSELLICQPIEAVANIVYTPTTLVIGPGHDGATAGKGARQLGLVRTTQTDALPLAEAGITAEPYVEGVMSDEGGTLKLWWTQLRNGPVLPAQVDFVPTQMEVRHVVEADGDLLEWAEKVKSFLPGTVVHGSGLGSHYGVHCVQHNIPFVTSHLPTVGEVLAAATIEPLNPASVKRGLILAQKAQLNTAEHADALKFGLLALHAFAVAPEMGITGMSAGYGIGIMLRASMALGCGEWRYCGTNSLVTYGDDEVHVSKCGWTGKSRDTVYQEFFAKPWGEQRKLAIEATKAFRFGHFGGGFGGQKWHDCMRSAWKVESAARQVIANPCRETVDALIAHTNVMIHKAHNGGWWFNKRLSKADLDNAAAIHPMTVINLSPAVWRMLQREAQHADVLNKSGWPLMAKVPQHYLDWRPAQQKTVPPAPPSSPLPWPKSYVVVLQVRVDGKTVRVQARSEAPPWNLETNVSASEALMAWLNTQHHTGKSFAGTDKMYRLLKVHYPPTLKEAPTMIVPPTMPTDEAFVKAVNSKLAEFHKAQVDPFTGTAKAGSVPKQAMTFYEDEPEWSYV